jgi:hypothetical protein
LGKEGVFFPENENENKKKNARPVTISYCYANLEGGRGKVKGNDTLQMLMYSAQKNTASALAPRPQPPSRCIQIDSLPHSNCKIHPLQGFVQLY